MISVSPLIPTHSHLNSSKIHLLLNTKQQLEDHLSLSTSLRHSLFLIRKLNSIHLGVQPLRKRLELSLIHQADKKDMLQYLTIQQNKQLKIISHDVNIKQHKYKKLMQRLNDIESIFVNEKLTKELAINLLGDNLFLNVGKNGQYLGDGESRKEGELDWKRVGVIIYNNLLFLTKPGSDTFVAIIHVVSQFRVVSAEDQRRHFMIKVGKYILSAPTELMAESWKDQLSNKKLWFEDKNAKKVLSPRNALKFQSANVFNRMSVSVMSSVQLSPHIDHDIVIGISLQELSQRENNQNVVPRVYRLLIEYLINNCCDIEGILRKSGSKDDVQQLEQSITKRTFSLQDLDNVDPHAITSTLKSMFRQLPILLIPRNINDAVEKLVKDDTPEYLLVNKIKELTTFLPPVHFEVFKLLCKLFTEIINYNPINKMNLQNVLSCFVESVRCSPSIFSSALQNQGIFFGGLLFI
ncbi:Rho-GAP domain-containing protein [Entamoeba marina]